MDLEEFKAELSKIGLELHDIRDSKRKAFLEQRLKVFPPEWREAAASAGTVLQYKYRKKSANMNLDKIVAIVFGVSFLLIMLTLALFVPNPTSFQYFVFRVILSLAAGGIGAVIPGFLNIKLSAKNNFLIRAGGACAFAVLVYFFNPPALIGLTG